MPDPAQPDAQPEPCRSCNGAPCLPHEVPDECCQRCNGRGVEPDAQPCEDCDGDGFTVDFPGDAGCATHPCPTCRPNAQPDAYKTMKHETTNEPKCCTCRRAVGAWDCHLSGNHDDAYEMGLSDGESRVSDWLRTAAEVGVPFDVASSGDFHAIAKAMCHALADAIERGDLLAAIKERPDHEA